MDWIFSENKQQSILSPPRTPSYFLDHPPPPPPSTDLNLDNKVSPSILLIIIILSIIFFVSGLLHLLVRFLLRSRIRDPDDLDNATAIQGQLQELFQLHDSGVEQSFIDTLPVFSYKAIIGGKKNPFDCAVCLCEFEPEDELRLLPNCSHAFHMGCIDTWLLSHSTCPICRTSLLSDFSRNSRCFSSRIFVLEPGSESARGNVSERDGVLGTSNSLERPSSHLGSHCSDEFGSSHIEYLGEIEVKNDENPKVKVDSLEKVVSVKLGKLRNVDDGSREGSTGDINIDARRCFSMGYFAYVMDENSSLQVPIRTSMKKQSRMKASLPLKPGHRSSMSDCGFDSRREFTSFQPFKTVDIHGIGSMSGGNANGSNAIGMSKRESFSLSKIWLRVKKELPNPTAMELSRRAFSFRFPLHWNTGGVDELKPKNDGNATRRIISEIDIGRWENGGRE